MFNITRLVMNFVIKIFHIVYIFEVKIYPSSFMITIFFKFSITITNKMKTIFFHHSYNYLLPKIIFILFSVCLFGINIYNFILLV